MAMKRIPQNILIESSWNEILSDQFNQNYFLELRNFLNAEIEDGKILYPCDSLIFNAFNATPFRKIKAVIIGQDPYHSPGQAMGLSFSVPKGISIPPSLKNIYKELNQDLDDFNIPDHGDLSSWANEGVFLLNAMLTVEHKKAGAHKKIGWQSFTDNVISKISLLRENVVFLLWGNFAKKKKELIDSSKHLVLEAAHPSPLARGAFFGNQHFSKTNTYLNNLNISPINWKIE